MGDGGGAHACLVCEYTAGHAVAHGCGHAVPYAAPQGRLGCDGARHDALQRLGNGRPAADQHHHSAADKQKGHAGHQGFADPPDAPDAAQDHQSGQHGHHQSHRQPVPAEGRLQGGGDGVGLHHISAPQGGGHTAQGKQGGQRPAAHSPLHVAHGAALPAAVSAFLPVAHRQGLFYTSGHHAQKGGHPHPEHRPRPAVEDGSSHPGDGASANGGGQGGGQGLELGKPPALPPPLRTEQGAQRGFEPQPDVKELKEAGPHRKIQAAE